MSTPAGMRRLRELVLATVTPTYETRTGIVREKTAKRREIEREVAEAVVRFAFDHGGYRRTHLAPGGLREEVLTTEDFEPEAGSADLSDYSTEKLLDGYASLTHRLHALRAEGWLGPASDAVKSARAQRDLVRAELLRRAG